MSTKPNDQAHPIAEQVVSRDGTVIGVQAYGDFIQWGMTKREEFAKAAMMGMHAGGRIYSDQIPRLAVEEADKLIAALNEAEEVEDFADTLIGKTEVLPLDKTAPEPPSYMARPPIIRRPIGDNDENPF